MLLDTFTKLVFPVLLFGLICGEINKTNVQNIGIRKDHHLNFQLSSEFSLNLKLKMVMILLHSEHMCDFTLCSLH